MRYTILFSVLLAISLTACKDNYDIELRQIKTNEKTLEDSITRYHDIVHDELRRQIKLKEAQGASPYKLLVKLEENKIEGAQAKIAIITKTINEELALAKKYDKKEEIEKIEKLIKRIEADKKLREETEAKLRSETN